MCLAGLRPPSQLQRSLDITVEKCLWHESVPVRERCGVLFQQTTLLDALTVAGNVQVALSSRGPRNQGSNSGRSIKDLLEMVGLDYGKDGPKRVTELSGGMARRASLALQLAQNKHVIVLDEPFAGLDLDAALGVAKELRRLRSTGTALLLISHEPELVDVVMGEHLTNKKSNKKNQDHDDHYFYNNNDEDKKHDSHNKIITLLPPTVITDKDKLSRYKSPNLFGTTPLHRFVAKLCDYLLYSLPLILLTFTACGLAISMLSSDMLGRVDVNDRVLEIIDTEVRPLLKMVTGGDTVNPLHMIGIKMKVRGMLNTVVPELKAKLYALGMAKLFVLEIGPLVTALLLSGRIGGSYAGEVATMQATSQNSLLVTLGINPQRWTLLPALAAALVAAPLLTVAGTALALFWGGLMGGAHPTYGYDICDVETYWEQVWEATLPALRLRGVVLLTEAAAMEADDHASGLLRSMITLLTRSLAIPTTATLHNLAKTTFSDSYWDSFIEIITYPPFFHLAKAICYIAIIMLVAETTARLQPDLTPRKVPRVITSSVVVASLCVIVADWGFSQLLLKRY